MQKSLLIIALLSLFHEHAISKTMYNVDDYIKQYGTIKNMMRMKEHLICSSNGLSGSSTYEMAACSRALKEDSRKKLEASEKRLEEYLADFDDNKETGIKQEKFASLYVKTKQAWREYVQQQCALHVYEIQPPGLQIEIDSCIALENYIMAERLDSV